MDERLRTVVTGTPSTIMIKFVRTNDTPQSLIFVGGGVGGDAESCS